jgi:hypothetical protein
METTNLRENERAADANYLEEIRARSKHFSTKLLSRKSWVARWLPGCALRSVGDERSAGNSATKWRRLGEWQMLASYCAIWSEWYDWPFGHAMQFVSDNSTPKGEKDRTLSRYPRRARSPTLQGRQFTGSQRMSAEANWADPEKGGSLGLERIRFITHEGKQILFVDFSYCSVSETEETARAVPDYVTVQPLGSVLLLVDFTEAAISLESIRTMQQNAIFDKPYIKRSAWMGTSSLPDSFRLELSNYSRREFPVFQSRREALQWLVEE